MRRFASKLVRNCREEAAEAAQQTCTQLTEALRGVLAAADRNFEDTENKLGALTATIESQTNEVATIVREVKDTEDKLGALTATIKSQKNEVATIVREVKDGAAGRNELAQRLTTVEHSLGIQLRPQARVNYRPQLVDPALDRGGLKRGAPPGSLRPGRARRARAEPQQQRPENTVASSSAKELTELFATDDEGTAPAIASFVCGSNLLPTSAAASPAAMRILRALHEMVSRDQTYPGGVIKLQAAIREGPASQASQAAMAWLRTQLCIGSPAAEDNDELSACNAMAGPRLVHEATGSLYLLPRDATLFMGRSNTCDIVVPAESETVKVNHCVLTCNSGNLSVDNYFSWNRTCVNGVKITMHGVVLAHGDVITLGRTATFRVVMPSGAVSATSARA